MGFVQRSSTIRFVIFSSQLNRWGTGGEGTKGASFLDLIIDLLMKGLDTPGQGGESEIGAGTGVGDQSRDGGGVGVGARMNMSNVNMSG